MDLLGTLHPKRVLATEHQAGRVLTFGSAADLVARWSNAIAAKSEVGTPVVIATPNGYDQFLLCLAVARAGRLAVPVNDQMRPIEIDHVIADSGATLVIRSVTQLKGRFAVIEAATPDPEDVAALFYTSGTTGLPKGAALTHRSLIGQSSAGVLWPSHLRTDEVVAALPVAHIMGFVTYLGLAMCGVAVYCLEHFNPVEVLEVIERRDPSGFIGVPAMYRMLEEAGASSRDLRSIRVWCSGADAMPSDLIRQFKRYGASACLPIVGPVGEAMFLEGYGMVEAGGGVAAKVSLPLVRGGLIESLGFRLPGYRFRVVDPEGRSLPMGAVGELWIKGPGILREYWHSAEATRQTLTDDGWLRTGDLVRSGPLGTIVFQGRKKHVLKSGGYSVYPIEVEAAIEEHPDVLEAAVVGLPHETLGQIPAAAVRLRPRSKATVDELLAWCDERLAEYKAPRRIVVVKTLPKTGTNKVAKDRVAELFA